MKKLFKKISSLITLGILTIISALPAFAEAPVDNGSAAKSAVLDEVPAIAVTESSALPQWLFFSAIGLIVVVGIIIAAVVMGSTNDNKSDEE